MAKKPTATFEGNGGSRWKMDLPLIEPLEYQLSVGKLTPVDAAAKDYARSRNVSKPEPEPEPESEPEPEVEVVSERPPEAGPGSGRDLWAAYAASKGVEVGEDDTRADIIAKIDES